MASDAALLIVAGGFETRARALVERLGGALPRRLVVVRYTTDVQENDISREKILKMGRAAGALVEEVEFDPRLADAFVEGLSRVLTSMLPDLQGDVWLDVSALPMQGICGALAAIRTTAPLVRTRVFYTEAEVYYPTEREFERERSMSALSKEMSHSLIMKRFGGSVHDASTCLVVFVGYEAHRALGVVDQINPSKLVVVYGRPGRQDLDWRLAMSRKLHQGIDAARPTAIEEVSTLRIADSMRLLQGYYDFLFDNHNFSVAPICSKMQTVASYLFWEKYRDVQLVFPLPVTYQPKRFSRGAGKTYTLELPAGSSSSLPEFPMS